ncbi:MAG: histidine kinase dimerization/phosphoacceptor domain -containing protein [Bryobacteraceae bacterium]|jgi:PAS domain S-box-containing protein
MTDQILETATESPCEALAPVAIRVLILEDRAADAELMLHELRRSCFQPVWQRVDTEADYLEQLEPPPDVILADYRMPRLDAPKALELLQGRDLDIPFIVVSGAIGEDVAVAMMRQGATDYLLKDRLRRLGPAVRRALAGKQLRQDTRLAEKALRASEARFYSFMNHTPALAFIKDGRGRILYVNHACEQAWQKTLSECEGKLDAELWPEDYAGRVRANDLLVLLNGTPTRVLEEQPSRDGRVRQMLCFRFPFTDAEGALLLGAVSIDITEQIRTEKALASALAAKAALLREVHHRVKNNLQVVSSLLSMQAELLPGSGMSRVLNESQRRVEAMAMIHERLHGTEDTDRVDFREYVEALARELFYAYGVNANRVALRLDLGAVELGLNQAIPCGLILNELLTNSVKYAFPEARNGEILVALGCDESDRVTLRVADNGVGLPGGFDWKQSRSLGLRIVNILARQLDGTLQWEPGPGAAFALTFHKAAEGCATVAPAA